MSVSGVQCLYEDWVQGYLPGLPRSLSEYSKIAQFGHNILWSKCSDTTTCRLGSYFSDRLLADVDGIYSLFEKGQCSNVALARDRMSALKAKWKELVRVHKGTDAERVVEETLIEIVVKSNSTPNRKWSSDLYAARSN